MTDPLESTRKHIEEQLPLAEQNCDRLSEQLRVASEVRDRLRSALNELKPARPPKARKSKAASKATKPSPQKPDVMAACVRLVKDNQPISRSDLESLVNHTLKEEQGFSLSGAALLFGKCLSSGTFAVSPDGEVSLASIDDTGGAPANVSIAG